MKKSFVWLLLLWFSTVSLHCNRNSVIYIYPELVYCKYDYTMNDLEKRYKNVPVYRGTNLKNFVSNLVELTSSNLDAFFSDSTATDKPLMDGRTLKVFTGASVFQVFIDEKGKIESVFLVQKSAPFFDRWATEALKNSHFKPLKNDGRETKYSVFVTYPIIEGKPLGAYINGVAWNRKQSIGLVNGLKYCRKLAIMYSISLRYLSLLFCFRQKGLQYVYPAQARHVTAHYLNFRMLLLLMKEVRLKKLMNSLSPILIGLQKSNLTFNGVGTNRLF